MYKKFIELRSQQEGLAIEHEEQPSYEMAYLSRWCILEKILKILHTQIKADEIHIRVRKWWEEYLSNPASNQSEPLGPLNLKEAQRIPQVEVIEKHLGRELPITKEIMNSDAKWRRKRNRIAHQAEPFSGTKKYNEFRDKILQGISEIEQALNDKCN